MGKSVCSLMLNTYHRQHVYQTCFSILPEASGPSYSFLFSRTKHFLCPSVKVWGKWWDLDLNLSLLDKASWSSYHPGTHSSMCLLHSTLLLLTPTVNSALNNMGLCLYLLYLLARSRMPPTLSRGPANHLADGK